MVSKSSKIDSGVILIQDFSSWTVLLIAVVINCISALCHCLTLWRGSWCKSEL